MHSPSLGSMMVMATLATTFPVAQISHAESATWNFDPTNIVWETAANWTPNTVPDEPEDIATFDVSNEATISITSDHTINGIVFNPGATAFTFNDFTDNFTLSGAGIINDSGVVQNIKI